MGKGLSPENGGPRQNVYTVRFKSKKHINPSQTVLPYSSDPVTSKIKNAYEKFAKRQLWEIRHCTVKTGFRCGNSFKQIAYDECVFYVTVLYILSIVLARRGGYARSCLDHGVKMSNNCLTSQNTNVVDRQAGGPSPTHQVCENLFCSIFVFEIMVRLFAFELDT